MKKNRRENAIGENLRVTVADSLIAASSEF
jgi:hypothetical protein